MKKVILISLIGMIAGQVSATCVDDCDNKFTL